MADLMAKASTKQVSLARGSQITGEVITVSDAEVVLDLNSKTEGLLPKNELSEDEFKALKPGVKMEVFVIAFDNKSGQAIVSLNPPGKTVRMSEMQTKKWQRVMRAYQQRSRVNGRAVEVNRGGLVVEVDGNRGFLPSSQLSFEKIKEIGKQGGLESLIGKDLSLAVIEVDPGANRLIFSNRTETPVGLKERLVHYNVGQKVKGKVAAVLPIGICCDIEGIEGLILAADVSWERIEDLQSKFAVGQEIEAAVAGVDESTGRVNLSLRQLTSDPFEELAAQYQVDDVVKGTITNITQNGMNVALEKGVEGFISSASIESGMEYEIGLTTSFLVDSIDKQRRKINLAPFLTSTKGLIYK